MRITREHPLPHLGLRQPPIAPWLELSFIWPWLDIKSCQPTTHLLCYLSLFCYGIFYELRTRLMIHNCFQRCTGPFVGPPTGPLVEIPIEIGAHCGKPTKAKIRVHLGRRPHRWRSWCHLPSPCVRPTSLVPFVPSSRSMPTRHDNKQICTHMMPIITFHRWPTQTQIRHHKLHTPTRRIERERERKKKKNRERKTQRKWKERSKQLPSSTLGRRPSTTHTYIGKSTRTLDLEWYARSKAELKALRGSCAAGVGGWMDQVEIDA